MNECSNKTTSQLPQYMIDIMLEHIQNDLNNPSGVWQDYNCLYNQRNKWKILIQQGMICPEDLPDMPSTDDYPDLTTPKTVNDCPLP